MVSQETGQAQEGLWCLEKELRWGGSMKTYPEEKLTRVRQAIQVSFKSLGIVGKFGSEAGN